MTDVSVILLSSITVSKVFWHENLRALYSWGFVRFWACAHMVVKFFVCVCVYPTWLYNTHSCIHEWRQKDCFHETKFRKEKLTGYPGSPGCPSIPMTPGWPWKQCRKCEIRPWISHGASALLFRSSPDKYIFGRLINRWSTAISK